MSDQDRKSRIRWTAQERQAVASSMARLLKATPKLTKLQAVTHAQTVLPPSRRRAIQSWASVQGLLQPHMKDAPTGTAVVPDTEGDDTVVGEAADVVEPPPDAAPDGEPPADPVGEAAAAVATDDEPPADGDAPAAAMPVATAPAPAGVDARGLPRAASPATSTVPATVAASIAAPLVDALNGLSGALGDMLARSFGDALLRAVASPAFAEALAAQVTAAVNEAVARLPAPASAQAPPESAPADAAAAAPPARPAPRPRVLVAGLLPGHADELRSEFGTIIDLRFWRPGESREQLKSAARGCAVAVVIADAVDATVESELRGLMMRPIRHSGNLAQLKTRLHELVEHNLFGMLGS